MVKEELEEYEYQGQTVQDVALKYSIYEISSEYKIQKVTIKVNSFSRTGEGSHSWNSLRTQEETWEYVYSYGTVDVTKIESIINDVEQSRQ